ncbi:MAG: hypothetical protein K8S27_13645 [Candidatus Omnitrophica bacterium]|nr:hypothetical protein [Candidatus Omnitrophota bacterium]
MNRLIFFLLIFLLCGCATYERRIILVPQEVAGWGKNRSGFYESSCKEGGVRITEIVLGYQGGGDMPFFIPIPAATKDDLEAVNKEEAWQYVEFFSNNRVDSCDASFIFLENQITGELFYPTQTKDLGEVESEEKYYRACYYYFDLPKDSQAGYSFHVSDKVFNCNINPLPLKYNKSFEVIPMQIM